MTAPYRVLFDRVLTRVDAETAHRLGFRALRLGAPALRLGSPWLGAGGRPVHAMGIDFPGPLGLAAGFDKNAEVPNPLLALGLGFVEVGTVTPRPQAGNPRPRLFRLAEDRGVINRMGFPGHGLDAARARLAIRPRPRRC